jgi:hypothetical protein
MPIVNLTPHPIAIYRDRQFDEGPYETIGVSGKVARLAMIELGTNASVRSGRQYELVEYGHVHDLPPQDGYTDYVVSLVVALAARGRDDLMAPYLEVRNAEGTMVGCRYLQKVC